MPLWFPMPWKIYENVDVMITPMLSSSPPPLGAFAFDTTNVADHFEKMAGMAPYAALANVSGVPAISVPHGNDENGLPLAVQLMGPMGSDFQLLDLASALESHQPWSYPWTVAGVS